MFNRCDHLKCYVRKPSVLNVLIYGCVLLILGGCGDNSTGSDAFGGTLIPGSFEATVSGAEAQTFSGISVFATQVIDPPVGNIFGLTLSSITNNPNYSVTVTFRGSNRPITGNHTIQAYNSDNGAQFVVLISESDFRAYRSTGGEMVITQSSAERLQGELTFVAELINDPDSKVNVSARFNANCQQASFLTCD